MCFVALRLEDEPLSEMSVELEGTAHVGTALPAWCEISLGVSQLLGAFLMTIITNYRVIARNILAACGPRNGALRTGINSLPIQNDSDCFILESSFAACHV